MFEAPELPRTKRRRPRPLKDLDQGRALFACDLRVKFSGRAWFDKISGSRHRQWHVEDGVHHPRRGGRGRARAHPRRQASPDREGRKRPFGVDIVQDGEIRRMVPNPAEMAAIERMQAMRRDGATYRAIGAVTGHGPRSVMRILERVKEAAS
jgi:hypothetical protein